MGLEFLLISFRAAEKLPRRPFCRMPCVAGFFKAHKKVASVGIERVWKVLRGCSNPRLCELRWRQCPLCKQNYVNHVCLVSNLGHTAFFQKPDTGKPENSLKPSPGSSPEWVQILYISQASIFSPGFRARSSIGPRSLGPRGFRCRFMSAL